MAKKGGTQTSTVTPDPETLARQREVWQAAQGAAGAPVPGALNDAAEMFRGYTRGGNLGLGAITGDPGALASFMNPFMSNVVDATKSQFADLNARTMNSVDEFATKSGAFGGDRHGIASGVALAEANKGAQSQIANLLYGGFNDAMGRAQGVANLGFGAGQALGGMADSLDPTMRRLMILRDSVPGGGQSYSQPWSRNAGAGFLGGAASGAGIAGALGATGPVGWGLAGLGGLLGLF